QHFTDTRVVIEDRCTAVLRRVVVAHSGGGHSHECGVAENHPRLFRPGEDAFPKDSKWCRGFRGLFLEATDRGTSVVEVYSQRDWGNERNAECSHRNRPTFREVRFPRSVLGQIDMAVLWNSDNPVMDDNGIASLRDFHARGVVHTLRTVIFGKFRA